MSETKNPEEKSQGRKAHLWSLLTYPLAITPILTLPLAALAVAIAPLVTWFSNRKARYPSEQALEATFFQLLLAALFAAVPWCFPEATASDKFFRFLGYLGVAGFHIVSFIVAMIETSYGKNFKHLFSIRRFFKEKRQLTEAEEQILNSELDNVSKQMYFEVMKVCEERTEDVRKLSMQIGDYGVKQKANAIVQSLDKLLDNFRKDPRDLPPSRHFMTYTLDTLTRILGKYVDMQSEAARNSNVRQTLEKVEPVLDTIHTALEKHHAKMLENDLLDLDVDLEVMEKTIEMGGI
jgi:5-bromo-4-chloroindolyl phosphate hydrolysis protein